MRSTKQLARRAGLLYLLACIPAPFALLYVPGRLLVPGNAAATAEHVRASEPLLRLGIAGELISAAAFIFAVFALYRLFKGVDQELAALMAALFTVSVPISFVNVLNDVAALILASGSRGFLAVFAPAQLDALVLLFLRLHNTGLLVAQIFWGLWLVPLGILIQRSGFLPRVLGIFPIIACAGYVAASFSVLLLPQSAHLVSRFATLLELGELPPVLWLLIRGAEDYRSDTGGNLRSVAPV